MSIQVSGLQQAHEKDREPQDLEYNSKRDNRVSGRFPGRMAEKIDIDHECRNEILRLLGHFKRIEKNLKEAFRDVERDLEKFNKRLERLEDSTRENPYP